MLALNYAFSGLVVGAIAALTGVGLLVTYRATGVFNMAHGAIGALAAYLFYELVSVWHVETALAAILVLVVAAPLFGIGIERSVFRPLQRREGSPAESLVATIGILALVLGIIYELWGPGSLNAPSLFPTTPIQLTSNLIVQSPALIDTGIVLLVAIALLIVTRTTMLGTRIRAVVDRRDLAELSAVDSGRVSAIAWATGSVLAALTGVLLAPQTGLTPFGLTLLLLEIFAVPVIAGLTSIPIAILAGLAIGIGQSEMNLYSPTGDAAIAAWNALNSNLPVVALLAALLLRKQLFGGRGDAGSAATLAHRRSGDPSVRRQIAMYAVAAVALFAPLTFGVTELREAQQVPALAVIFVSIVAVTGFSGQISLGQAGYAGLGALMFAKFSTNAPELVALLMAMIAAAIVGFVTGYPAIRRRGLFLALTTFAVGAFVNEFVFQQPYFTNGIQVFRPSVFGFSLNGDRAFYVFELIALAFAFFVMSTLQRGRLGRALIAIRDNEEGARSIGVDVRHLKIFIFTVSAGLAGLGGALLVQQSRSFDPTTFDPLEASLFWFAIVIVFGSDSAAGAVLGAGFVVLFDAVANNGTAYIVPIGLMAAFIGYLPGGAAEVLRRGIEWLTTPTALMRRYHRSLPPPKPPLRLSRRGQVIVDARRRAVVANRRGLEELARR